MTAGIPYVRRNWAPSFNKESGAFIWRKKWNEKRLYEADIKEWSPELSDGTDSISSVSNDSSSGITVTSITFSGTTLQATISGCGSMTVKVVTASGYEFYVPLEWQESKGTAQRDVWG